MNTTTDWIKRPASYAVPALMLFLLFQACGGSDNASADEKPEAIEGVWENVATLKDCASGATIATFRGAQVFHRGGTATDTNASPPSTRGPGFGTWTGGGSAFVTKVRFYNYDSTGQVTGTMRITRNVTVSSDGSSSTSVNTGTFEDLTGTVLRNVCASDVSIRVR